MQLTELAIKDCFLLQPRVFGGALLFDGALN